MHHIIAHPSCKKFEESNNVIADFIIPLLIIILSIILFISTGQFTVPGEDPLENFVVSYVPSLVLHLLQLLVSNIDSEYFVVPCEWYGVDIVPLRSASDPFTIVCICHRVDCMLLVLVVGCVPPLLLVRCTIFGGIDGPACGSGC